MTVSRQELVGWLQHHIAEQKRLDTATSGAPVISESVSGLPPTKDTPVSSDVQLILPIDIKKQRKQVKQLFLDRGWIPSSFRHRYSPLIRAHSSSFRDQYPNQVRHPERHAHARH